MSWSRWHIVHPAEVFPGTVAVNKPSDNFFVTQRSVHGTDGVLEVKMPDPTTVTVTGSIVVQGRLSPDAPWSDVFDTSGRVELIGHGPSPVNGLASWGFGGITILPQMRIRFDNWTPSVQITASVRMME